VDSGICLPGNYNPVVISDRVTRPQTSATGRPIPRNMVTTYSYNINIRRTDWSLPAMAMEKLIDDTVSFDGSVFIIAMES
jgi:hypothetical protein